MSLHTIMEILLRSVCCTYRRNSKQQWTNIIEWDHLACGRLMARMSIAHSKWLYHCAGRIRIWKLTSELVYRLGVVCSDYVGICSIFFLRPDQHEQYCPNENLLATASNGKLAVVRNQSMEFNDPYILQMILWKNLQPRFCWGQFQILTNTFIWLWKNSNKQSTLYTASGRRSFRWRLFDYIRSRDLLWDSKDFSLNCISLYSVLVNTKNIWKIQSN